MRVIMGYYNQRNSAYIEYRLVFHLKPKVFVSDNSTHAANANE